MAQKKTKKKTATKASKKAVKKAVASSTKAANFIRKTREKLNLDQSQFCLKTKISQAQLSKLENGKVGLSMDTAHKLNKYLKIPLDTLFSEYRKTLKKGA
jgi:transcriptional regulator with XRE-family HTH domain